MSDVFICNAFPNGFITFIIPLDSFNSWETLNTLVVRFNVDLSASQFWNTDLGIKISLPFLLRTGVIFQISAFS